MATFISSLFDTEKGKLWKRPSPTFKPFLEKQNDFSITSLKKTSDGLLTERFFFIRDNLLCYKKDQQSSQIRGWMNLAWSRVEFSEVESPELGAIYEIMLIRDQKFTCLYVKESEDLLKWNNALKKLCIQTDIKTRYELICFLGKGSFGEVYEISEGGEGEAYAAKIFNKEELKKKGQKALNSLKLEIELNKNLNHKNICKYFETHETGKSVYLIFEKLDNGRILQNYPEQFPHNGGKPCLDNIRRIMLQILEALYYLNSKNIVHRDLKPANIMLKKTSNSLETDQVKLIDFGLAAKINDSNLLYFKCGTPGYIAPEILNSKREELWTKLSSKIDIFSIGVILHRYLFNVELYEGNSTEEILKKNRIGKVEFKSVEEMITSRKCNQAYDLMRKMVEFDQEKRISIEEAICHPFFVTDCISELDEEEMDIPEEEGISGFNNYAEGAFDGFCLKKLNNNGKMSNVCSTFTGGF